MMKISESVIRFVKLQLYVCLHVRTKKQITVFCMTYSTLFTGLANTSLCFKVLAVFLCYKVFNEKNARITENHIIKE